MDLGALHTPVKDPGWPRVGPTASGLRVGATIANRSSIEASFTSFEILPGIREVPFVAFSGTGHPVRSKRVEQLVEEIVVSGRIDPLIVAIDGHPDGPYILEGSHRFDALQLLGKATFPALVVLDFSDDPVHLEGLDEESEPPSDSYARAEGLPSDYDDDYYSVPPIG